MSTATLHRPPPTRSRMTSSVALSELNDLTHLGMAMPGDDLTVSEAARELNISPATLRRWDKAGVFSPTWRFPSPDGKGHRRYSRTDIEAFKEKLRLQGGVTAP